MPAQSPDQVMTDDNFQQPGRRLEMLARQPRKLILLNIAPGKTIAAMSPLTWSIWSTSNINAVMCILHLFIITSGICWVWQQRCVLDGIWSKSQTPIH